MSPIPDSNRRELLILDSGPIRELLLHHAVFQFRFERLRGSLRCLTTPASYERCSRFIASFRRKATSACVVAELNYWIRATEERGRARLWHRVYDEYRAMDMQEEAISLISMDVDMVTRFGPVDASLFELAWRSRGSHPMVLTVDAGLRSRCLDAGFGAHLLEEL